MPGAWCRQLAPEFLGARCFVPGDSKYGQGQGATPIVTFFYLSTCTTKLPGFFGNYKKKGYYELVYLFHRKKVKVTHQILMMMSRHDLSKIMLVHYVQGCIFRLTCSMSTGYEHCSYPVMTKDHVLTSANVKIFRTVTRNAVNKSV